MAIREIHLGPRSRVIEQVSGAVREGSEAPVAVEDVLRSGVLSKAEVLERESRDPIATPQPPPQPGKMSVVDDLVVLLEARRDFGRKKYGTELQTFNGRDAYVDALQELVDLFQYLHQAQLERFQFEQDLEAARRALSDERLHRARAEAEVAALRHNLEQARDDLSAEQAAVAQLQAEMVRLRGR